MKIGIDASSLGIPFECGNKRYSQNLIKSLAKIDKKNEYILFCSKKVDIPLQKNFRLVITPKILPFLNRQFFLNKYAHMEGVDVFHFLTPFGDISFKGIPFVVTVHDVRLGETYPIASRYFLKRIVSEITFRVTVNKAKKIIVPTYFIKNEVGKNKPDVAVIPEGVGSIFARNVDKNVSEKNTLLCFGDFTERKNTWRVILAFFGLTMKHSNINLAIVSSTSKSGHKYKTLIRRIGLQKSAKVYVGLDDVKLAKLYDKSLALVYPSTYEGFGLPILEAMCRRLPVITSDLGACREVAGKSAVLVDPYSVAEIEDAMDQMVTNTKKRNLLISKGLENSKKYSWKRAAISTLKIYSDLKKH